jgi:LAO/AO transport system kinase
VDPPAPASATLAPRVLAGDPRAIARAMSIVEDDGPGAQALLAALHPHTGGAYLVGLTGPPGAGKSTLADRLTGELRRRGLTVGIVAVDPTSPFTGGAILGDRIRMAGHAGDPGVFVRSMATRGHLGGLARATMDVAAVLDAAGRDIVIVETVGVGQDEVDIARAADVTVLVLVPGGGDDVQAIKAGIMEIADVFVVNKADREGADRVVQTIAGALALQSFGPDDWRPPILKTDAITGEGVPALWERLASFRQSAPRRTERRRRRDESRVREQLAGRLLRHVEQALPAGALAIAIERVGRREIDPATAADELLREAMRARPGDGGEA